MEICQLGDPRMDSTLRHDEEMELFYKKEKKKKERAGIFGTMKTYGEPACKHTPAENRVVVRSTPRNEP